MSYAAFIFGPKRRRRSLGALSTFIFALAMILAVRKAALKPQQPQQEWQRQQTVSDSPGFKAAAVALAKAVNFSVDPCENFVDYACGNWSHNNHIPEGKSSYSSLEQLADKVADDIGKLLNETDSNSTQRHAAITKWTYDACLQSVGVNPLQLIENSSVNFGTTWPLLDPSWNADLFSVEQVLAAMKLFYGVDALIRSGIAPDERNTSVHVLHLRQASLTFGAKSEDFYTKEFRSGFQKLIESVFSEITDDAQLRLVGDAASISDIVQFEVTLASLSSVRRRNIDLTFNRTTIKVLKEEVPGIDEFVCKLLKRSPADVDSTAVNVFQINYLQRLSQLLKTANKTTVANYLLWRLIFSHLPFFSEKYRKFSTEMRSPRWKYCIDFVIGLIGEGRKFLGDAVGLLYVEKYFLKAAKSELRQMSSNLIDSFGNILGDTTWMDNETKQEAFKKISVLRENRMIGYPDFYDAEAEGVVYENLQIEQFDNFYDINEKLNQWSIKKEFKKIGQPMDKWVFSDVPLPVLVNAFYSPSKNAMLIPAAIAQPPLFEVDYPKAVNYGAMGSVIGHEIAHGFDDMGSQFDSSGNMRSWWSNATADNFAQRNKCFVDQYGGFRYQVNATEEVNVSGNSQGENIADGGGLHESFLAYQTLVKEKYPESLEEPRLPGLQHLSMNQVFFISYALWQCSAYADAVMKYQPQTDDYAPGPVRVTGALQNTREFAETFKCAAGSTMNPEKKCHVW